MYDDVNAFGSRRRGSARGRGSDRGWGSVRRRRCGGWSFHL